MAVIIVVEDNEGLRNQLVVLLGEISTPPHTVAGFGSVYECAKEWDKIRPDVLLTDWQLPRSNGGQLIKDLKRRGKLPPVVILMSSDKKKRAVAEELGVSFHSKEEDSVEHILQLINEGLARLKGDGNDDTDSGRRGR